MERLGMPAGFVRIARLLRTAGMHAPALVNGCVSQAAEFAAGLRQGCVLAQAEYLVVGQAPAAWLQEHGVSIR
ncbi:hypothetical protein MNEG_15777, partial [Monoraphidium neglectum]